MDEQSITLPVTPNSSDSSGVYSRRSSTGKMISSKGGEKLLPNYLRASTGSCHDFCKFGKKHATEEKERRPFPRRGIRKPSDDENAADIRIFVPSSVRNEKNNKGSLLSKSADSNSDALMAALSRRKTSLPGMLRRSADTKVSRLHESSDGKNKTPPDQRLTGSLDGKVAGLINISSKMKITSSREKKKSPPIVLRTLPDPETRKVPKSLKKGMPSSQAKLDNPCNQASPRAEVLSLSEKLGSSLKLKSSSSKTAGRVNARSNIDLVRRQKASTPKVAPRKLQTSPKVLLSPRLNVSAATRPLASPRVSKSSLTGVAGLNGTKARGDKVISAVKNGKKITNTDKKVTSKFQDKSKKVANTKSVNEEFNEVSPDIVHEKTLYVIKMDTEDKHLESDLNERLDGETSPVDSSVKPLPLLECSSSSSHTIEDEESEYSLTEDEDGSLSEYDETECTVEELEEKKKWNRRKGVVSSSERQDPQPVKLRFRRGKVIEIKSENDSPRKLKFRRRRCLNKDQNVEAEGRIRYKNRGDEGDVKKSAADSEKVVLRHQDVDGKKDGQGGLFNNVIEETASKLAETRKSKVKALVGAFETVISLQDGKPSGNAIL